MASKAPQLKSPFVAAIAIFLVSIAASAIQHVGDEGPPHLRATRVIVWAAALVLSMYALFRVIRNVFPDRISRPIAVTLTAILTSGYLTFDLIFVSLFGKHPSASDMRAVFAAFHTGQLGSHKADGLVLIVGAIAVAIASFLMLRVIERVPRIRDAHATWFRRIGNIASGVLILILVFRDLIFLSDAAETRAIALHTPTEEKAEKSATAIEIGPSLVEKELRDLAMSVRDGALEPTTTRWPNIVFIHVESLRADMLNPKNMPLTSRWLDTCATSSAHYSTGNTTGNGVFGAASGLSAAYHAAARNEHLSSVPLYVLHTLGYETHVWFVNEALKFDGIADSVFGPNVKIHATESDDTSRGDKNNVEALIAMHMGASMPRFDYIDLEATHYDYTAPPEFRKYTPDDSFGLPFNRRTGEGSGKGKSAELRERFGSSIFNRYQNAVLYTDFLIDRLLQALVRNNPSKDTIVAVFGDHGESFWDNNGPFGHNTMLNDVQTRVPFLFCSQPKIDIRYSLTSHADIFPTVFDVMGLATKRPFMTGKSLARHENGQDFVMLRQPVTSITVDNSYAIVLPTVKVGFIDAEPPRVQWVRDRNDADVSTPDAALVARAMATAIGAKLLRAPPIVP